jgi:hypothetical protein
MRDGVLSTVFNKADYVRESNLKNSGVATSSANTTFTGTVNTTRTTQTLSSATFTAIQSYSFNNGMVYSLASNDTPITSLSILNIPATPLQTYKFTFIIEPNVKSNPYYLNPTSNKISINETSVSLFGLSNIVLFKRRHWKLKPIWRFIAILRWMASSFANIAFLSTTLLPANENILLYMIV